MKHFLTLSALLLTPLTTTLSAQEPAVRLRSDPPVIRVLMDAMKILLEVE